jgi:peptidoglycan/xylan/chitin deacetylase (PgdA/CDA1 family)
MAIMRRFAIRSTTRRGLLASAVSTIAARHVASAGSMTNLPTSDKASIAITLDLEMSRNFPTWAQTHWDYEKGNLDRATKTYALEAARRVKAQDGVIHFFALGQTMEQADVGWLREIAASGHPIGNHSYDHVNVLARRLDDIQFRFQRAPWLIEGRDPAEVIASNIRLAARALKERIGIAPAGFRTPGGFSNGLSDRPDVQAMLLKLGYSWVSSKYPAHPIAPTGGRLPDTNVMAGIIAAQEHAQPFVYPSGLVELPMSPISDIGAFRNGRWPLEAFLKAIRSAVEWAIRERAMFCFLGHPSCLVVTDPTFRTIELICDLVRSAGNCAAIVDLQSIASHVARKPRG